MAKLLLSCTGHLPRWVYPSGFRPPSPFQIMPWYTDDPPPPMDARA